MKSGKLIFVALSCCRAMIRTRRTMAPDAEKL